MGQTNSFIQPAQQSQKSTLPASQGPFNLSQPKAEDFNSMQLLFQTGVGGSQSFGQFNLNTSAPSVAESQSQKSNPLDFLNNSKPAAFSTLGGGLQNNFDINSFSTLQPNAKGNGDLDFFSSKPASKSNGSGDLI